MLAPILRLSCALLASLLSTLAAHAGEFSVSPIRVDFKPGILSETITVTNHATSRLRVSVKLAEWTQDEAGNDVYKDSTDLIYFPRQLELPADSKRLVRVGVRPSAAQVERSYRLFIEEEAEPSTDPSRVQLAFLFRFGVPVFVTPTTARSAVTVGPLTLDKGKLSVQVRNEGTQHLRLLRVTFSDGGSFNQDQPGWYALAGSQRTYTLDVPAEICRRSKAFKVLLEGDGGTRFERSLDTDGAHCP